MSANGSAAKLDLQATLSGRKLVVVGGTGFLGKVWWSFLLARYPDVSHIYLVVRPKRGATAEERYQSEIVTSQVFDPIRNAHGAGYDAFMNSRLRNGRSTLNMMLHASP